MKKLLFTIALLLGLSGSAWASYDFSFTFEGNELYYSFSSNGGVYVTYPGSNYYSPYSGYTAPTSALTIPDSVTYNGITYSVTSIGD